jgi:glutathione synthase/RimK-type ligase-like ATP-grasp enzyme
MLSNIRLTMKACDELNLSYEMFHHNQNILRVKVKDKYHFFVNYSTPLVSQSVAQILKDKDYTYQLLKDVISMPKHLAFLSPFCDEKYQQYLEFKTIAEIKQKIVESFSLPVIVKRNRGSGGNNVFLCKNNTEIKLGLNRIFNINYKDYDYVALAQDYINIKKEYRLIFLNQKLILAYEKNTENANFTGNLSPLHWDGAKAIKIDDQPLLNQLNNFVNPVFDQLELNYGGFDIAIDQDDKLWLIEINSHPNFNIFIRDHNENIIVDLFKKILLSLSN